MGRNVLKDGEPRSISEWVKEKEEKSKQLEWADCVHGIDANGGSSPVPEPSCTAWLWPGTWPPSGRRRRQSGPPSCSPSRKRPPAVGSPPAIGVHDDLPASHASVALSRGTAERDITRRRWRGETLRRARNRRTHRALTTTVTAHLKVGESSILAWERRVSGGLRSLTPRSDGDDKWSTARQKFTTNATKAVLSGLVAAVCFRWRFWATCGSSRALPDCGFVSFTMEMS